jgi:hypothetical protein
MKVTGTIKDVSLGLDGKAQVTLTINEKNTLIQGLDELAAVKKLSVEMKPYREKRSNEANSYFWVLCGQLAAKLRQKKEDVYRELIRDIGDNFEILPIRNEAVEKFITNWGRDSDGRKKLGWICDILGDSKIAGYTNVCAYYGSSTYTSTQMSVLIDNVIFACKEQGIDTITPNEKARLLALWEQNQ